MISKELSREYLEKEFDLTEKDHEAAQRQVRHMAEDRYRIYTVFANRDEVKGYESFKTLVTVFHQQCKVTEGNETLPCEITIREKPEGGEIVSGPHNTDARYVKKGKQKVCGQKGFVSETCNEGNKTQFITDAEVTPATRADAHELPEIQKRLEESGKKPQEQYADAGFVNGQAILSSQADGIKREGPSAGRSQSFEKYEAEDRPLNRADFEVKVEREIGELVVVACPERQMPLDQSRSDKTGKTLVHVDSDVCSACRLNTRCPVKIGSRVSALSIDEASYAGAEATVSEMVRAHGMRRPRHRTEGRTRLQLIFAAIA